MGNITKNFSYNEFKPKLADNSWLPNGEYQKLLIDTLAKNLQIIRNNVPKGVTMKITSGVRTLSDYYRLVEAGYNPSKTSDHYCGTSVPLKPDDKKYKKFGETYNFAVGAGDIVSTGMKIWDLFKLSYRLVKEGMCDFGQVIYEKNNNGKEWIHYGNSLKGLFSKTIIDFIARDKFMKSIDGGKTYTVVNSI